MTTTDLPAAVRAVLHDFRTCELTTLAKDGTPVTWPIEPLYLPEKGRFIMTTSIGLPQKAFNIRRNPRVSLFFSTPIASGLLDPPTVLVQGDAEASEQILTKYEGDPGELMRLTFARQPAEELLSRNVFTRYLFDWFYMRLVISVTPRRILWWDHGDQSQVPHAKEVNHGD